MAQRVLGRLEMAQTGVLCVDKSVTRHCTNEQA